MFTYLCLHCSSCATPIPSSGTPTGVVRPGRGNRGKEQHSGLHTYHFLFIRCYIYYLIIICSNVGCGYMIVLYHPNGHPNNHPNDHPNDHHSTRCNHNTTLPLPWILLACLSHDLLFGCGNISTIRLTILVNTNMCQ